MFQIGKNPCPKCVKNGRDNSGDNFYFYGEGKGGFCWSCHYTLPSDEYKQDNFNWEEVERGIMSKSPLTKEERDELLEATGTQGQDSRGLTDKTYRYFAVRFGYDDNGNVDSHYYPVTDEKGETTAFKVRYLPKTFSWIGKGGKDSQLFGQWKHTKSNAGGKYVVIASGEVDAMSVHQMLEDYRISRNSDFAPIPVVSSVVGETASYKQIQAQYEWLNRYDQIILIPDQDEAGQEAVEAISKVVPKNKLRICSLPEKDCNDMLTKGKHKQFIQAFYDAKPYSPNGIVGSATAVDAARVEAMTPKLTLPPFMKKVNEMMAGGIPLGRWINIGAASGLGKSTFVDEIIYHIVMTSPYNVGIVSLESDVGQYHLKLLSRHIGHKIDLIEKAEDKVAFLNQEWVIEKEKELVYKGDVHRYFLIDERDGSIDDLKDKIEQLIIQCDCKVICIDPIQDLMSGFSNEEQSLFCKWMKGMMKSHSIIFLVVSHTRKSSNGEKAGSQGADLAEESLHGVSDLYKSAACNILLSRNKEADSEIERNSTHIKMTKCRWTGKTGKAGVIYYNNNTHTLHDLDEWLLENTNNT